MFLYHHTNQQTFSVECAHFFLTFLEKKVKTCPLNFTVNKRLDVSVSGLSNRQDS